MIDLRRAAPASLIAASILLAACDPAPSPSPSSGTIASGTVATASPEVLPPSGPTEAPESPVSSGPPAAPPPPPAADLPAELADPAWVTFDSDSQNVAIGMLGRPVTMTIERPDDSEAIRSAGRYVIFVSAGQTRVVDASDGSTFAEYAWPRNAETFDLDSDGRVIYFSRWNGDDDGSLWRMRIDGTGLVRLTDLGSRIRNYGYWRGGFEMRPDGSIVAVTCAADGDQWTDDAPCRLYVAGPEANPDQPIRLLMDSTPPICRLAGVTAQHAVFYSTPSANSCFADGGFTPVRLVTVDLEDRTFASIPEDHALTHIGFFDDARGRPSLVAAQDADFLRPNLFWPYNVAVVQNLRNGRLSPLAGGGGPIFTADWHQWAPLGAIGDWVVLEGVGRDFLLCRYQPEQPSDDPRSCGPDTGAIWDARREQLYLLPLGTYGDPNGIWD